MLTAIFLLFISLTSGNQALPIFERGPQQPSALDAETNKRSMLQIVWSCIVTTFLCAWVSVHPNIQPYKEGSSRWGRSLKKFGRRCLILFFGVVTPEAIVLWASMEYLAAKRIKNEFKENKWTMAHGHLLEMGGFVLEPKVPKRVDNEEPSSSESKTLTYESFKKRLAQSEIEFPTIKDYEIQDHSKGDLVTKTLAALQTLWFVVQCIARFCSGLAVTELEIATLALATLNLTVLFFWKDKPLDMEIQVSVHRKEEARDVQAKSIEPERWECKWLKERAKSEEDDIKRYNELREDLRAEQGLEKRSPVEHILIDDQRTTKRYLRFATKAIHRELISFVTKWPSEAWHIILLRVFLLPLYLAVFLLSSLIFILATPPVIALLCISPTVMTLGPVDKYFSRAFGAISADTDDFLVYLRMFPKDSVFPSIFIAMTVGVIFGGLHCIGWNFTYPTPVEQTIWRVVSLTIALIPFLIILLLLPLPMKGDLFFLYVQSNDNEPFEFRGSPFFIHFGLFVCVLLGCIYGVARFSLLVLAVVTLREQPASAFVAVKWTKLLHLI